MAHVLVFSSLRYYGQKSKVCSKAVCFSRVWSVVLWKNSGNHETNSGKVFMLTVTPDLSRLTVKCVTLHNYTKGGRLLCNKGAESSCCVTLKSASFWKLQLCWIQQANWNNRKLNKQRHMGYDIGRAAEAFHSRKGRSFFFVKASHSAAEAQTGLHSQLSNQEQLFCNRKIFNLKNISDIKTKLCRFHKSIKNPIFKKSAHNCSPAFTYFSPRR